MLSARPTPAVAGSYVVGATIGALGTVFFLLVGGGLLSPIPSAVRAGLLLAVTAALALRATGVVSFPLPQNKRQIAQEAFLVSPPRAAFRFALELGTSVRTYITKEAPYAAAALLLLAVPSGALGFAAAGLLAAGFGVGRSLMVTGQVARRSLIVEHPGWTLSTANLLTMAIVVLVAVRSF